MKLIIVPQIILSIVELFRFARAFLKINPRKSPITRPKITFVGVLLKIEDLLKTKRAE